MNKITFNENDIKKLKEQGVEDLIISLMPTNKPSLRYLALLLYSDVIEKYEVKTGLDIIYNISSSVESHYRTVYITKKNGKKREINKPDERLSNIQKRIYKKILANVPVSENAVAYVKGRSIKQATKIHIGKSAVLKLDIKNFFGSINFTKTKDFFSNLGFDKYQAITLANLCCYKGRLPQGTPTSPILSNIVMNDFDNDISSYCLERNIAYTRYSDDMIFSGDFDTQALIEFVSEKLNENGFSLNDKKTKIIKQGQRQSALGVTLNEKQQVTKEFRKKIRQEIYYCQKHSMKSHIEHMNDKRFIRSNGDPDFKAYIDNIYGRINFALQINPDDTEMRSYKIAVKKLFAGLKQIQIETEKKLFDCAAQYYERKHEQYKNGLFDELKASGFTDKEIYKSPFFSGKHEILSRSLKVHTAKDDLGNILSVVSENKHGFSNEYILKRYEDGFFGSKFDTSVGYLIITSDKLAALHKGITNLVSFNGPPYKFCLTVKKRQMIKRFGDKVIIRRDDIPSFIEWLETELRYNNIEII